MRLSDIKRIFDESVSFIDVRKIMQRELKEYESKLKVKGGSTPIYLIDDCDLYFGEKELIKLCQAFLEDNLSELELNYIADALLLSNKVIFKKENIADELGSLTDPQINGKLDKVYVSKIMKNSKLSAE